MKTPQMLLLAAATLVGAQAHAVTIGFEEVGNVGLNGTVVTTQYPGVVFGSDLGHVNRITTQPLAGGIGQNFLCTANAAGIDCAGVTTLDFTTPVSGLSFYAIGNGTQGPAAKVDIYVKGLLVGVQDVVGDGNSYTPDLVDLTAYSNITSIRMRAITDGGGMGWDNFSFTAAAVPEPSQAGLTLLGLCALVPVLRRSTRRWADGTAAASH